MTARDPRHQIPFDVAVVIPTVLEPELAQAVGSVFDQDYPGRVQILIGIDVPKGDPALRQAVDDACPERMAVTWFDAGYSTSRVHGGTSHAICGGFLRSTLSFMANADRLAFLDADNWWSPHHLSDMLDAIDGFDWAFTFRWFVDPVDDRVLCVDDFESVGPGRGIYARHLGGFVDTNCLMIDRRRAADVLHLWGFPLVADGSGNDRRIFHALKTRHPVAWTRRPSVFYRLSTARGANEVRMEMLKRRDALPKTEPRPYATPVNRDRATVNGYLSSADRPRLAIGDGSWRPDGWLSGGPRPVAPDTVRIDPRQPLPFRSDGLFDRLAVCGIIGSLDIRSVERLLAECRRILKPDGRVRVATLDPVRLTDLLHADRTAVRETCLNARTRRLSGQGDVPGLVLNRVIYGDGRRCLLSEDLLADLLLRAGFGAPERYAADISDDPLLRGIEGAGSGLGDRPACELLCLEAAGPGHSDDPGTGD